MSFNSVMADEPVRKELTVEQTEALINKLAQGLYAASGRTFRPLYPWVFVRVLPDRETIGGIAVPQRSVRGRTHMLEGVVLATWEPREGKVSELKPGDHVCFLGFAGVPVEGFSRDLYRVVKEENWSKEKDGGICAIIERTELEYEGTKKA